MGSQYTIITRKTYDSLPNKPPLSPFNSSGIGVDGHTFCFDGRVYLNFSFDLKEGGAHQVEYESVLVSKEINSNIFGAKTENKFKSCHRDFEKSFIEYKSAIKKNLYSQQHLSRLLKFLLYLYEVLNLLKEKFLKYSIKIQTKFIK